MFSHAFISVSDFDKAFSFYSALMRILGNELKFVEPEKPWAGWHSAHGERPLFVICHPYDGGPQHPGNGQMLAFNANHRRQVIDAYQTGLAKGGTCEGAPGLRPHYHPHYFAAYLRDPDGNKICVVCHAAETEVQAIRTYI